MQGDICPICNEGFLTDHLTDNDGLLCEYSICSYCGAEQTDYGQLHRNKIRKQQWSENERKNKEIN